MSNILKRKSLFIIFIILLGGTILLTQEESTDAFSNQVVQMGAVGDDVIELQSRLKYIGFYKGEIDGAFGWGTYWALRNFQSEFGLPIDGLAGLKTKQKLESVTKYNKGANETKKATATNVPSGFSQNDIQLMANAVHGESRGEPYVGQVAVAAVILNRVNSPSFPNTVSGVIFEPRAFTAVADGQIWLTPNETSKKAVLDAINGWDPTGNAIYYFNPDTATSGWIWGRPQIKQIGKHIFCK
ncbi:spore cortex-lytic enzyme [Metabacillus fastidiosus]|uniref:spore cortex-lytic enzyme n=1 Tax=Metabacillus fastidiosus TaxID=1458 RepID=UPI002E1CCB55|nr:spore cortex-lytic enzyme [Metabacillus fastidiosus]MED4533182.1 spore cortex-lytic enzyme [Metabacillus fastidiosus]